MSSATATVPAARTNDSWITVCAADAVPRELGVAALVAGRQIAVFRTHDDRFFALDNRDPFTGANVISRGIVGDRRGRPTVASPLHKQVFDLADGSCLDDLEMSVVSHPVRTVDGRLQVHLMSGVNGP